MLTSVFSTIHDINASASNLNSDLQKISEWVFKWKMPFNSHPTKQAQEVIFSRKMMKPSHAWAKFNNLPVQNASPQKKLHKILDENLWVSSEIKMFPSWHSDVVTTLSQHYWWRCHNIVARSKVRVVPTSVSDVMTTPQSDIVKTFPQRCYNVATRLTR